MKEVMAFLKEHSLSIVLILILLIQSVDFFFIGHKNWVQQQQVYSKILEKDLPTGYGDYLDEFRAEMMVSMLADTYGAVLLVLLNKSLYEKGSEESKSKK